MKKTLSYTAAFGIGFVVCGFALKAMYGFESGGILPGSPSESVSWGGGPTIAPSAHCMRLVLRARF